MAIQPGFGLGARAKIFPAQPGLAVQAHSLVYPAQHAQRPEVANFIAWLLLHAQPSRGAT